MSTPSSMPGAKLTPAGALAKLITDLADAADNGQVIDLEVIDSLAGLTSAYAQLLTANTDRRAARNG